MPNRNDRYDYDGDRDPRSNRSARTPGQYPPGPRPQSPYQSEPPVRPVGRTQLPRETMRVEKLSRPREEPPYEGRAQAHTPRQAPPQRQRREPVSQPVNLRLLYLIMLGMAIVIVLLAVALFVTNCTGDAGAASEPADQTPAQAQPAAQTPTLDFDGAGRTDVGDGTIVLTSPSGASEDSGIPIVQADGAESVNVTFNTEGVDSAKKTFVYIDGMEATSGLYTDGDNVLALTGSALKTGEHTVEFVQFSDDTSTGEVTFYRKATYLAS